MKRLLVLGALIALTVIPAVGHAQTTQVLAVYQTGWNMVGGPQGTDFSSAAVLYSWQNRAYVAPSSKVAVPCTGYWAYFYSPATVTVPAGGTVASQTCPLADGWNLVGNPFSAAATLPAGTVAYVWNTVAGAYLPVTAISPGQAAWIYSTGAGSIVLTNSAAPVPAPAPTLTINYLAGAGGPYTIHVGDTVKVLVPAFTQARATADLQHFQLTDAGYMYDLTCTPAACQTNPTATFWTWKAIATGTAYILIVPNCQLANPSCGQPAQTVQFTIVP